MSSQEFVCYDIKALQDVITKKFMHHQVKWIFDPSCSIEGGGTYKFYENKKEFLSFQKAQGDNNRWIVNVVMGDSFKEAVIIERILGLSDNIQSPPNPPSILEVLLIEDEE